ncbi:MAG: hypothetical protein IPP40_16230 [bacterium]|nr:hypothetical protein [bacterium]
MSASREYTATITDNVRDLAGNAMAHSYIWSFHDWHDTGYNAADNCCNHSFRPLQAYR